MVLTQREFKSSGMAATLSRNVAASVIRLAVSSMIALVLPAFLTHRLPAATYGAWVLILQLSTYVSFLDFGAQAGVAKFVAEYEAKGDEVEAGRHASAGLAIMSVAGLIGLGLTIILAWQVPHLFRDMPPALYRDVRTSVLLVGGSMSIGLACSAFSSIFAGLQRYSVPMSILIINRLGFAIAIVVTVMIHGSLAAMGAVAAIVNILTAMFQFIAWRKWASRIQVSLSALDYRVLTGMFRYCSLLAIWTIGMVCVSGLDVTIVGHYAYDQTGYFSVATLPTNLILALVSSMLGPLMPASSAASTQRSSSVMAEILVRATRYSTIVLLLTGLPLLIFGQGILRLWVGPVYALHCIGYLRILVVANVIRSLCAPYATLLAATGRQGAAAAAAISEAIVNLTSSIYLASRFGAVGVAFGTLLGSFVSVALHFSVSMPLTQETISISRSKLARNGFIKPALITLPSIFLLLAYWRFPWILVDARIVLCWSLITLLAAWFGSLNREERTSIIGVTQRRLSAASRHHI